jgi:acetyl esterase/lipase
MAATDIELVRELIALQAVRREAPLAQRRLEYDAAERAFVGEAPVAGAIVDAGGCDAEWVIEPREPSQPVVVYFHGGGYVLGSSRSHRHLARRIGVASQAAVLSVDYRLAPECPFPAGVEDAFAASSWLLETTEHPVVLAGDSAGGGLVVSTLMKLRDATIRVPTAGVCLSPWADLTMQGASLESLAARDPLLSRSRLEEMASMYLGGANARHPHASPALADLSQLPPLLIQVSDEEILRSDALALARAARRSGVEVTLEEWRGMVHVWQWYLPVLADARRAIETIGHFVRSKTAELDRRHVAPTPPGECSASVPLSPIQEAHLLLAPESSGRGYLSWVYQLNGRLDRDVLSTAVDEVVRRFEMLRVRIERKDGRLWQKAMPFSPGALEVVDLTSRTKGEGLTLAQEDARARYQSLSPLKAPGLHAVLYEISARTSVLAMFIAETAVDSDAGSLVTGELSNIYSSLTSKGEPSDPVASDESFLAFLKGNPVDPDRAARSQQYWQAQAEVSKPLLGWPTLSRNGETEPAVLTRSFSLTPREWSNVVDSARLLGTTPYIFVLTSTQTGLARVAGVRELLIHTIVPLRTEPIVERMIGNFQSMARISLKTSPEASFRATTAHCGTAVVDALAHCAVPAPLAKLGTLQRLSSGGPLPDLRFYMFSSHDGPAFKGLRRRRFRLHAAVPTALTLNCVSVKGGRQDFVFSSATASERLLCALVDCVKEMQLRPMAASKPEGADEATGRRSMLA